MSRVFNYNRQSAVDYARRWAKSRNPNYFNYDKLGGDCTNFISQCIYAGDCNMNYNKSNGWYYINGSNKSPAWTGTNFLYRFLISNKIQGPFARISDVENIELGDIVQVNFEDDYLFNHTLIITSIGHPRSLDNILICSHTFDRLDEPISSIRFRQIRFLQILGTYK